MQCTGINDVAPAVLDADDIAPGSKKAPPPVPRLPAGAQSASARAGGAPYAVLAAGLLLSEGDLVSLLLASGGRVEATRIRNQGMLG